MAGKEFFRGIDHRTRLRVLVVTKRRQVSRFMVQMETLIEELWTPIARYDTHHGFAHLDLLRLDGTADKIPIVARDFNEALQIAFADLLTNWDRYDELPRSKLRGIEKLYDNFPQSCHPRMFLSGVQSEFRLDSR